VQKHTDEIERFLMLIEHLRQVASEESTCTPDEARSVALRLVREIDVHEANDCLQTLADAAASAGRGDGAGRGGDEARRLHDVFLQRGVLWDRLYDVIHLNLDERRVKWDAEADAWEATIHSQRKLATQIESDSKRRAANRAANAEAWDAFQRDEGTFIDPSLYALQLDEATLLRKPPIFWYTLPLEELTEERLLRALMGRLDALFQAHGQGTFPQSLRHRYNEQLQRLPCPSSPMVSEVLEADVPAVPVQDKRAWCLRAFCCPHIKKWTPFR
jgi:hypothetical protein